MSLRPLTYNPLIKTHSSSYMYSAMPLSFKIRSIFIDAMPEMIWPPSWIWRSKNTIWSTPVMPRTVLWTATHQSVRNLSLSIAAVETRPVRLWAATPSFRMLTMEVHSTTTTRNAPSTTIWRANLPQPSVSGMCGTSSKYSPMGKFRKLCLVCTSYKYLLTLCCQSVSPVTLAKCRFRISF